MSAPALDAQGLEAAADSLTPMGRAARWPQEYVEEQAAFVVAAYLRAAEAPKAASPPAEWPWPREVCFRCLHVLHPTDEGACNCDFRGEAPIRVRVVKAEGLAERLEGTDPLTVEEAETALTIIDYWLEAVEKAGVGMEVGRGEYEPLRAKLRARLEREDADG